MRGCCSRGWTPCSLMDDAVDNSEWSTIHRESCCCRNVRQYPEASQEVGLLLVRLDAPLYFANVQYVRDRLRKYETRSQVKSHRLDKAVQLNSTELPAYHFAASQPTRVLSMALSPAASVHSCKSVSLLPHSIKIDCQTGVLAVGSGRHCGAAAGALCGCGPVPSASHRRHCGMC